jgi:aminoglycoside phosphotransferase (APT) family kinase protein
VRQLDFEPRLFHGDLVCNLQNLLVDAETGDITGVVDWESSGSGPATHYDLALSLRTWHRDGWPEQQIAQNFAAFLRGYGLSIDHYQQQYQYDVETLLLLLVCDLFCLALRDEFTLRAGGRESFKTLIRRILPV